MQKLHLVGFTTDQDGLILSARRGARSGGYTLVLDDALAEAVDALRARQEDTDVAGPRSGRADRVESRLPVSEIQVRLRRGRSLKDVAKDAGVEPEWVERFAAPVFAEQAQVIARVRSTFLRRPRLGPSGMRIGDAVRRNLVERGVIMSPAEFDAAWTTQQRADGRWVVRFSFHYRGSNRTLRFDVAEPNGEPVAADSLTGQLAYVTPPPKRPTPRPKAVKPEDDGEAPTAKRAVVSVGFRAEAPPKAVSRPAKERERAAKQMTKAAARRAIEGERGAARKARERSRMLAQREREARADEQRRQREQAARVREAAIAARIAAAEQAEREKAEARAVAARQAERDAARRIARSKAKSAPPKTGGSSKGPARKASAARSAPAGKATPARPSARPRPERVDPQRASAPSRPRTVATSSGPAPRPSAPASSSAPPRPSGPPRPDARVDAVPPPATRRAERRASEVPAAAPRPEARPPHAAREPEPPAPRRRRVEPPVEPRHAEGAAAPQERSGLSGAAVDVYGPEATRALFRAGLVEQAGDGGDGSGGSRKRAAEGPITQPVPAVRAERAAGENGSGPRQRPPGARRTRPLRAT
ncbi:MAG: septation protein SepH [Acidimicrobiales bacterium]|nr:septation protein SepH [Acidimicrobiales bacterium]